MLSIQNPTQLNELKNNKFYGELPNLNNSVINFKGKNIILICEENVTLENSRIEFNQDNSILYLSNNNHNYKLNLSINNNNLVFIGKNNFMNGTITIVLSEEKNVIIGENNLFSYNIVLRVADAHLIYSSKTHKRINISKSIVIGDHVWIGESVRILKGCIIGSGAIIGAGSVLSNKKVNSNTSWAGNPAKEIRKNIFWSGESVHTYTKEKTLKTMDCHTNEFIYSSDENTFSLKIMEETINNLNSAEEKKEFILNTFTTNNKNRFHYQNQKSIFKKIYKKLSSSFKLKHL